MSFIDRVDPDLRPGVEAFPPDLLDLNDIAGTRQKLASLFGALPAPVVEDVGEGVPGLARRRDDARVVAVGEDLAAARRAGAPPDGAVDVSRRRDL